MCVYEPVFSFNCMLVCPLIQQEHHNPSYLTVEEVVQALSSCGIDYVKVEMCREMPGFQTLISSLPTVKTQNRNHKPTDGC